MSSARDSVSSAVDAVGLAKRSAVSAVVTDGAGRVLFWNRAAADLFGRPSEAVCGELFPEIVQARDVFSNRMFHDPSRFRRIVELGEPVKSFAFDVETADGRRTRVAATVLVILEADSAGCRYVYQLRETKRRRRTDLITGYSELGETDPWRRSPRSEAGGHSIDQFLTRRQLQVLERVARGSSTREISKSLGITVNTVRSHTQSLLERLGVHSKVEAVAVAMRRGIL